MTSSEGPQTRPGRRLRWLAAAIPLAIAVYSGGWYWLAGKVDMAVSTAIETARGNGEEITCENHKAGGFPFRLGLFCDSISVRLPSEGIMVAAGAFRSAAQVYQPSKMVAELDSPGHVEAPGLRPLKLDWENLRASFVHDKGDPERVSIETRAMNIGAREAADAFLPLAEIADGEAHMRINGEALDLAASGKGIALTQPGLTAIPEALFSLDASLSKGAALVRGGPADPAHPLRGQTIELRDLTYAFPDEQASIVVTGTVRIDDAGLADGALQMKTVKPEAFGDAARIAFPEAQEQIDPIVNGLTAVAQSGAPVTVTLTKSRMSAGLFPLGDLPPL